MTQDIYIRRNKVASLLGVSGQQVDNYRKKGYLKSVQYIEKGVHRYKLTDVLELMKAK